MTLCAIVPPPVHPPSTILEVSCPADGVFLGGRAGLDSVDSVDSPQSSSDTLASGCAYARADAHLPGINHVEATASDFGPTPWRKCDGKNLQWRPVNVRLMASSTRKRFRAGSVIPCSQIPASSAGPVVLFDPGPILRRGDGIAGQASMACVVPSKYLLYL